MNILVIGSGGREHALCWKLSQSPLVKKIYCATGNGGTSQVAENVDIDILDNNALAEFAKNAKIDLTVIGPEAPLVNGIVDEFEKNNLPIFGPRKYAAMLEGSKVFSKKILLKNNIPTGRAEIFDNAEKAIEFAKNNSWCRVVKADGLAAGKGVYVCDSEEETIGAIKEIMMDKRFGDAGNKILLEEKLVGEEASFLVFSDGKTVRPMLSTQDHKPVYDNDKGPNTGGMGAYGPAPVVTKEIHEKAMNKIMIPVIEAMAKEGTPYKGVLYGGLMIVDNEPYVIEFNCRFGDPEAQPILMMLKSDLLPIIQSCINGTLEEQEIEFYKGASCCVVLASGGYPVKYEKGKLIEGLDKASDAENVVVFQAGTKKQDNAVYTNGGRVLGVTGRGDSIKQAIDNAYEVVKLINFEKMYYRKDIGAKALSRD